MGRGTSGLVCGQNHLKLHNHHKEHTSLPGPFSLCIKLSLAILKKLGIGPGNKDNTGTAEVKLVMVHVAYPQFRFGDLGQM